MSSIYAIRPHSSEPFVVFCDMSKGRTPESASASFIVAAYKPEDYQIIPLISINPVYNKHTICISNSKQYSCLQIMREVV